MKLSHILILAVFLNALLVGCGGSARTNAAKQVRTGKATFTIKWPVQTSRAGRLIPDASNSIKVEVRNGNTSVSTQVLSRPSGGGNSTLTFNPLPVGSLTVFASAFPQTDGTGTAQATAATPLIILAGQNTPFSLTLASTIDHLELSAVSSMVLVNGSQTLNVAAKDAGGTVVLLSPAKLQWQSSNTAAATVDASGKVTGVGVGSANISVTDTESGKSTSFSVSVALSQSPSVAYQINAAHSGATMFGTPLTFPASPTWSINLNNAVSYPLIVGGKVYVQTNIGGFNNGGLYALDERTGAVVWGPISAGRSLTYDRGKIFTVGLGGTMQSFDAATGQPGWSVQLPGQYDFDATPTAINGVVYEGGAGSGGTLYAVNETNGAILWTASVENGQQSSPAISEDGVFVSYPCQVYKFNPITGAAGWHYNGPCEGGGGKTAAYANGQLFVRDFGSGTIYDASSGSQIGTFPGGRIPALGAHTSYTQDGYYFQGGGTLRATNLSSNQILWSFAGDGALSSAPLLIDQTVIVGSNSGNVYALDAASGQVIWTGSAGAPIPYPDEQNASQPLTGFGAGDGYLVVAAGNRLTAWHIVGP